MAAAVATPTTDLDRARDDLDRLGYCVVENVMPEGLAERLRIRVLEQARAELGTGEENVLDDNTQWVANVINKGAVFLELLTCSEASLALARHVLGPGFILSCANAPIAGPGNRRMEMHSDQYWTPAIPPEGYEQLGERGFSSMRTADRLPPASPGHLFPPCMVTLIWAVTDFTSANGATLFVPGSHRSGLQPEPYAEFDDALPAEMPQGSVTLWDGRTWHATGCNQTADEYRIGVTNNFVAPMIRPLVNYPYSLRPEVVEHLDERQRQLLGFATWGAYGNEGVPSKRMKYFRPSSQQPGELRPGERETPT